MQDYKEIKVWLRAHELCVAVYSTSRGFPKDETYGLRSQLRSAASSIPANIAEGSKKIGRNDFVKFLNVAEGSLGETTYFLLLARDLDYIPPSDADNLLSQYEELGRRLHSFRRTVERTERKARRDGLGPNGHIPPVT